MPDKYVVIPGRNGRDEETEKWEAQLRKGCLEMAVLAVLAPGKSYGLEIIRALENHSNLVLSEGTIYPILNRLRQDGLVDSMWVESDSGHPRKYYSLTRKGRERAVRMAEAWQEFAAGLSALVEPLVPAKKERPAK
ncbi:MAG TPA: PadR family transcriptional regulator [Bryobacteraceae bacterium]